MISLLLLFALFHLHLVIFSVICLDIDSDA